MALRAARRVVERLTAQRWPTELGRRGLATRFPPAPDEWDAEEALFPPQYRALEIAMRREALAALPQEGETLHQIRARIFGYHIGNNLRSGRKLLRKNLIGPRITRYYVEPVHDDLLRNLKADAAKVKLANLKRRGKGPPKKGQGKRSKDK